MHRALALVPLLLALPFAAAHPPVAEESCEKTLVVLDEACAFAEILAVETPSCWGELWTDGHRTWACFVEVAFVAGGRASPGSRGHATWTEAFTGAAGSCRWDFTGESCAEEQSAREVARVPERGCGRFEAGVSTFANGDGGAPTGDSAVAHARARLTFWLCGGSRDLIFP